LSVLPKKIDEVFFFGNAETQPILSKDRVRQAQNKIYFDLAEHSRSTEANNLFYKKQTTH